MKINIKTMMVGGLLSVQKAKAQIQPGSAADITYQKLITIREEFDFAPITADNYIDYFIAISNQEIVCTPLQKSSYYIPQCCLMNSHLSDHSLPVKFPPDSTSPAEYCMNLSPSI